VLARLAERSLDVQYYIWHGDTSGFLLFEELWNAAGRGVRVRLLLDDNGTSGLDEVIAALDSHPGIEVRLFNPFAYRGSRALGYLGDFERLNRRMHNKSFTGDSQLTIVGGRNVGDEYLPRREHGLPGARRHRRRSRRGESGTPSTGTGTAPRPTRRRR